MRWRVAVTQRIDRIAQMLSCPIKGEEMRRAITESRKKDLAHPSDDEVSDVETERKQSEDDVLLKECHTENDGS